MTESQLQDAIRLALGSDPALCLWRNNIGHAVMRHGARVTFGVGGPGGADLIGMFKAGDGRALFVALEIKTPTGRQSPEQRQYEALVRRLGGEYAILRSVDEALSWLETMHRTYAAVTP